MGTEIEEVKTAVNDGADILNAVIGTVVELPPEEFVVVEALSVRPDDGADEQKEQAELEELAHSLKEEGQIQDASCYPKLNGDGTVEYHLWAGNRRRTAMAWANANLKGKPMTLRARVFSEEEGKKLRRKAIHENIKRRGLSALQFALLAQTVRKEEGWETGKDTAKVARYFGVSPAQITQHEKLLKLPEEVKVQASNWRADPAQFLATQVVPEQQAEVAKRATEIAQQEELFKTGVKPEPAPAADGKPSAIKGKRVSPQTKHVAQAAREKQALSQDVPLTRKEILEHIQKIADGVGYGHEDAPVRLWAAFFVEKFATGKVKSDKGVMERFDAMIWDFKANRPYAGEGTEPKPEKAEKGEKAEGKKGAKGKSKAA